MKETPPQRLSESFVATTSLEGHAYVCHFQLQSPGEDYLVTVLNKRYINPFLVERDASGQWRIRERVPPSIRALEFQFVQAVIENNKN